MYNLMVTMASTGFKLFDELNFITVMNVVVAIIVVIGAIDKVLNWIRNRGDSLFTFRQRRNNMENTVETDHTRLDQLEDTMRKESAAMKEILKSQLMERHDAYTNRTPQPYITRYERAIYMTTYQLYCDIDRDPTIDEFYRDILDLPLHD